MDEYIKRSDAIQRQVVWHHFNGVEFLDDKAVPVTWIQAIPPADVKPVVRGEWIYHPETVWKYECNRCGCYVPVEWNYCPHCGADMRGGDAE